MTDKAKSNSDVSEAPPPYSSARPSMESDRTRTPQSPPSNIPNLDAAMTKGHQRFVLTDPVALKYLQEDPSTAILSHPTRLKGYECFVVEQWACSRTHPTFIITTYTGDPAQSVVAQVLSVPTNEDAWSPRLKVYFKALNDYHARRRETPLGTLMVTNLSAFPSSLTCVSVPEGDPKKHREIFFVNENLKRLGCSGRVGLTLTKPTSAAQSKFYQLYRASEKIDLNKAVIELVKLCQVALTLFDVLGPEYADGLLCDVTEKAISDWWVEIGNDIYNVEPQDGILGPTTVAALLGTLIGARNRLNAYGAQIAKDVFEIDVTKRAIAYFQKSQRIPKTRRLDRTTLKKLHSATAKAATKPEGWNVPRVVKATVADLGGKGGEMVLDTLGAKEKAGLADVETVDMEQFVDLIRGERAKWLWYGKPRKGTQGEMFNRLPGPENLVFTPDEHGGYSWQGTRKPSMLPSTAAPGSSSAMLGATSERLGPDEDGNQMPKLTKRNTAGHGGIGKIRNAVGLRTHVKRTQTKEDLDDGSPTRLTKHPSGLAGAIKPPYYPGIAMEGEGSNKDPNSAKSQDSAEQHHSAPAAAKNSSAASQDEPRTFFPTGSDPAQAQKQRPRPAKLDAAFVYPTDVSPARTPTIGSSIEGSTYRGVDLDELFPLDDANENVGKLLRRRHSAVWADRVIRPTKLPKLPRQLSFSAAEESILTWDTSAWDLDVSPPDAERHIVEDLKSTYAKQMLVAEDAMRARAKLAYLDSSVGRWVDETITSIVALDELADQDMQELDSLYFPRLEAYQGLKLESKEALAGDKARLTGIIKDVEILGAKLEYEINALRSKVEDVENGVDEYERQVRAMEGVAEELEQRYACDGSSRLEAWKQWCWKSVKWMKKGKMPSAESGLQSTPTSPLKSSPID